MKKNIIIIFILSILFFLSIKIDKISLYHFLHDFNKIDKKALEGNKEAIGKSFMYYIFEVGKYTEGELFFRKLDKKGYLNATEFLSFILIYIPPHSKERYLEGMACLKKLSDNGNKVSTKKLKESLILNRYNLTIINIKDVKCNVTKE